MSAAALRRKKQMALRGTKANGTISDPVQKQLNTLLADETNLKNDESSAYEALQLAQSLMRKSVKKSSSKNYSEITAIASKVVPVLLSTGEYLSMASQLMLQMMEAMEEVQLEVSEENLKIVRDLDALYGEVLSKKLSSESKSKQLLNLQNQRVKFLQKGVKWSEKAGDVKYGDKTLHSVLGSVLQTVEQPETSSTETPTTNIAADAVSHMVLAEEPEKVVDFVMTKPIKERDVLLTRSCLQFIALENLRDANTLLQTYISKDGRDFDKLATQFLAKGGNAKPNHVIFCTSVYRIVQCEQKAGALFTWLKQKFQAYLQLNPELEPFLTKIGKVYFNIQPPPSMLSMMENMLGMMGGGGLPMGLMPPGGNMYG